MCLFVFLIASVYFTIAWSAAGFVYRDGRRRRTFRIALLISMGLTAVVVRIGVPYTYKSTEMPAVYASAALLLAGPFVLARLSRTARLVLAAVLAGAFAAPFLRVEYLTWRYGEQLRAAYVKEAGKGTPPILVPGTINTLRFNNLRPCVLIRSTQLPTEWSRPGQQPASKCSTPT